MNNSLFEFFQNKDPQQFFIYAFFIFILCLLIFNFAFKNGSPTCNNFIVNSYLYIGLGVILLGLFTYAFEYYNINFNFYTTILSFILTLILIFAFSYVRTSKNIILNHIIWLFLIIGFSIMIYPMISLPQYKPYINRTLMIVACIFFIMTLVVYLFPKFFESTYGILGVGLFVALLSVIIVEIIYLIYKVVNKDYKFTEFNKFLSYFVIVLFSVFISFDTQTLKIRSKTCKESNIFNYPNYPFESIDIILDLINLFVRILGLSGKN